MRNVSCMYVYNINLLILIRALIELDINKMVGFIQGWCKNCNKYRFVKVKNEKNLTSYNIQLMCPPKLSKIQ